MVGVWEGEMRFSIPTVVAMELEPYDSIFNGVSVAQEFWLQKF